MCGGRMDQLYATPHCFPTSPTFNGAMAAFSSLQLKNSYLANRKGITRGLYTILFASFGIRLYRNLFVPQRSHAELSPGKTTKKVRIDINFLKQLQKLLAIAFPHFFSIESALVVVQALLLVLRTYLSLRVAQLDGKITSLLVKGEGRQFLRAVGWWMVIGLPASSVNAAIQYVQKIIALRIRANVTEYAVQRYMSEDEAKPVFYRLQINRQTGVNVGQIMVSDTARFCSTLPRLYSNLAKPLLDVGVYMYELGRNLGPDNVFLLGLAIQLSARFLRLAAPPFGEFVASEAKLEGEFRQAHSRIIEYSEEIALYSADKPEKRRLDHIFYTLVDHVRLVLRHHLRYSALENMVIKYCWGAAGLVICSVPIFSGTSNLDTRAQTYVVNRKLLLLSSDAIGRLMTSYKEISSLAGTVARIADFLDEIDYLSTDYSNSEHEKIAKSGLIEINDYIEFDRVPIISPAQEILIKELSFKIERGHHLLIVGPNGCGKSSMFRILGGIWPLISGRLTRPDHRDIFYIPQRPYISRGSLRQQIIYPESESESRATDEELMDILQVLGLESLVESETEGLDTVREWHDDLSMGAQQKIAAARLFYHRPHFAILDECTASVTGDIETTIYTHAKSLGISLLSVSHRATLWKYHDKILQFDGQGGYVFADLNPQQRLALMEEKLKLGAELRRVGAMKERLYVLEEEIKRHGDN